MSNDDRSIVLITGASGTVGTALVNELGRYWTVVGLDLEPEECACEAFHVDLTDPASVNDGLQAVAKGYGKRIASVIHLAAYFDFSGDEHPLYEKLNVEGTRHLLRALQWMEVDQFVYPSTMLVHRAGRPGERMDESAPIEPKWAYPISKANAEQAIREEHGDIPYVLLRMAGIYDDESGVPTLTHQIARIYERALKSRFYAGSLAAGQSYLHRDDMVDAIRRTVTRRSRIPSGEAILLGEPETLGYGDLQEMIGRLIHGAEHWRTAVIPAPYAKAAAWVETKAEPVVPDDFDQGTPPFIRPFMIDMAEDHYELDIGKAKRILGWTPKRRIARTLPSIVDALKSDPARWYAANGIDPPHWLTTADSTVDDPEALRRRHERRYRARHRDHLWAHFTNVMLGFWLLASGITLGYQSPYLVWSDAISGVLVAVFAAASLSWRFWYARWMTAAVGLWLLFAPLLFWAPTAAAYLNDSLVGALVIGFSVLVPPVPSVERTAAEAGPDVPPGWDFSPSSWLQRAPIIALAVIGLLISRYLAAYQLGHIDAIWDPFFPGGPEPTNGTEEIITSSVSKAWPVPDAGLGATTYMLEILTGMIGSIRRWRTMPWLVIVFGIMIVPLGTVSIAFIVIQPIVIGTWCTLCLVAAAAMLLQIPYSMDELVATGQFLLRRWRAGAPMMRVFLHGDIDDREPTADADDFERPPGELFFEGLSGGIGLPWTLGLAIAVGVWLMFTRLTLGSQGGMADADHLIGALVITIGIAAMAETIRTARLMIAPLGAALWVTPFVFEATAVQMVCSILAGAALIAFCLPRGRIRHRWGGLERRIR